MKTILFIVLTWFAITCGFGHFAYQTATKNLQRTMLEAGQ